MNCDTDRDRETYRFYQAAINALELRHVEDSPGCTVPPKDFVPRACKDTALTAFAQLGALRLGANRGLISLIDGRYQYILAEATRTLSLLPNVESDPNDDLWLGSVIIPRSKGVCEHVLSLGNIIPEPNDVIADVPAVIINDLLKDPRFGDRSYVQGNPGVRFYAGVPLRSPWGTIIGAYCVFGHEPRNGLSQEQLLALQGIATTVMTYLETSKAREGHRRYEQMLHGLTSFVVGESSLHSFEHRRRTSAEPSAELRQRPSASHAEPETPLEDTRLPRNKKRPRNLSNTTPTARKKSTISLQETMLPSGSKEMFSRAANIIRESIDVCGCIIFDASVATFGGAINTPHRRSSVESMYGRFNPSSSETSSSYMSGSDDSSPPGEPWGLEGQLSSSDGDFSWERKMCEVLGFSCGSDGTNMSGDDPGACGPALAEADLKRLLRKYPFGHIFNVSSLGDVSLSQAFDNTPQMAPSSEVIDCRPVRPQHSAKSPSGKPEAVIRRLLRIAPKARSIAILPLWDYQRERWFAGCLCWTTEPTRVLYPDVDLIYLQAFGNSIMTELSRIDAISSDRAKTTFVASISHELRCPLHGILGGVQFLQDTEVDAYQAGMLDSVATCGKTLLDTIDHVLDFAKVNTFTKVPSKSSKLPRDSKGALSGRKSSQSFTEPATLNANVDLAMLTEEVIEAIFAGQTHRGALSRIENMAEQNIKNSPRNSASAFVLSSNTLAGDLEKDGCEKALRIILDIPHRTNWVVTTQPGAWRRVVMNLFGNALKYTSSGFIRISLRVKPESGPRSEQEYVEVILTVADSGKGISTEYLRGGLWTPFSQEDSFSPGTGLGLSIVKQIVDGLGGNIDLKSELHVGTEVRVTVKIPLAEELSSSEEDGKYLSMARAQLADQRICVLERLSFDGLDSSSVQEKARSELSSTLLRTLKLWFGAEAVKSNAWTSLSADVIISLEPRADFLTTVRTITPPEKKPIVILVAADANHAAELRANPRVHVRDLFVDIITQPCGPRKLAKSLSQALDRQEKQTPLTVTPLASPSIRGAPDGMPSPAREWKTPNWIPAHPAQVQPGPQGRVNSIVDPKTLPRTPVGKYSANASMQEPPTESHLRILLVDDNRINLSLLTAFMKKYNFEYEEAMNGLQAVETFTTNTRRFDYVLMDLTMPVMDGMAATREIRRFEQREGLKPTTIIALTGLASATARVEALNSGINYFLTKPVKFQALHQMLKGTAGG